ncbi:MAG TPA: hypothetical protein VNT79_04105 [Phycisphaerae bacterium]|nr:hypothetical protein [Phycisphaerae bacterium]
MSERVQAAEKIQENSAFSGRGTASCTPEQIEYEQAPAPLTILFPVAVGFKDRPARCHAVAGFFAAMGNTLREIGVESWYVCHPAAAVGLEQVCDERKFIRDDHRDFGALLDRTQPDVIFQWTGASDAFQTTRRMADERGIPIRYAELGWFPQSTTMYFDLEGTNARSSIRRIDLSTIAINPGLDDWLTRWRHEQLQKRQENLNPPPHSAIQNPKSKIPGGYIFVPLQDERDTNITLASPYRTMDAFVSALAGKFPTEHFIVRPHPHFADVALTPRSNVHVTTDGSLHQWLSNADAVVGINSTVLLESLAWNKPTHSVGVGLATGLDVMYESGSVDDMTLHREIDGPRRERTRRLLSELIFVRQFNRKDLHYLDKLKHAHGIADLVSDGRSTPQIAPVFAAKRRVDRAAPVRKRSELEC